MHVLTKSKPKSLSLNLSGGINSDNKPFELVWAKKVYCCFLDFIFPTIKPMITPIIKYAGGAIKRNTSPKSIPNASIINIKGIKGRNIIIKV